MISVPFQNNLQILERGSVFNSLLIQPVVPFKLNADWNLISRTIVPVLAVSGAVPGFDKWGLGDIQQSVYFSPREPTSSGGVGRTYRIGAQPVTTSLTELHNVERPTGGPEWNIRFQMTFMFPPVAWPQARGMPASAAIITDRKSRPGHLDNARAFRLAR